MSCLLITKKFLFWIFWRWKIWYFWAKSWCKYDIYWLLKSSCFGLFGNGKYSLFLSQKVDGKMIFTDYWKALVLNFSVMGNTFFLEQKSWWKDDSYWFLRSTWWCEIQSFFQPKRWWKDDIYLVFFSFPWYFRTLEIWLFAQWSYIVPTVSI